MLVHFLFLLLVGLGTAFAEPFARVDSLAVHDAAGRLKKVQETADAVLVEGERETPLAVGMELPEGAVLRTALARVVVLMDPKDRIEVAEGSRIVLQQRSVIQELGDVYYKVRGAFSVRYGVVEATVEGTVFEVHGPEPVWVGVVKGKVRVRSPKGEVLLRADQRVNAGPGGELKETEEWPMCGLCGYRHKPY